MSKELMPDWLFDRIRNSVRRPDPMSFFRDRRLLPHAG